MPIPFGLLEPVSIAGGHDRPDWDKMPVHIMFPVDSERAVLVSIDERGKNYTTSDPHARVPVIMDGPNMATTALGKGLLLFVDLKDDGFYHFHSSTTLFPPAVRFKSIGQIVKAVCNGLGRPCPHWHDDSFRFRLGDSPQQQPGASSSKSLLNTTTLGATSSICPQAEAVTPPSSPIIARLLSEWGKEFYIRSDHRGLFHTYPDVGGPFKSIEKAEKAIDQYLHVRRDPKMCLDIPGISRQEMGIRRCLFWPDGTMKRRTRSYILQKSQEHMCRLVHAVVDQYNEDHNLVGDLAYELKDVTEYETFDEKEEQYRHLNFTAMSKGADGLVDKQFFVELTNTNQEGLEHEEWVVSCFCMIGTDDNGCCTGCPKEVKHPNKYDAYTGGHVAADEIFEDPDPWSDSDEDETSRERRIRRKFDVPRKPFVYPACAVPKPT